MQIVSHSKEVMLTDRVALRCVLGPGAAGLRGEWRSSSRAGECCYLPGQPQCQGGCNNQCCVLCSSGAVPTSTDQGAAAAGQCWVETTRAWLVEMLSTKPLLGNVAQRVVEQLSCHWKALQFL